MIRIYERSLCQSYASAYRAGIKIGEAETREDALKQVEAMTEDSYQCFAVDDDGTCIDLTGTFPGCLAGGGEMSCYIIELADCALTPYAIETESGTEYGWGLMPKRKVDLDELLRVADECDAADVDGVTDWAARIRKPADECPDGPRYKAIGNSMAVPVMRWIGERIAMAEAGEIA